MPREKPKDEIERKKLTDYIQHLSYNEVDWPYVMSRVKQFKKQGMTYSGMRYALWYQVNIKEIPYDGIELIPYCYSEAKRYWEEINRIKESIADSVFGKQVVMVERKEKDDKAEIFE